MARRGVRTAWATHAVNSPLQAHSAAGSAFS